MKAQTPSLYLIDISSLFFRSYYAISLNMKNEQGLPTNALYGVLKMLNQLSKNKQPDYMISCFDSKEPSFRKKIYPEYKANRAEMPEDLEKQVPYLKIMMDRMRIPSWEKPGFEADDLIASLAVLAKKRKWRTYIVSGDKDFAQIVDSEVHLYDTMKDLIYNPLGVEEKWGLPPSQMQDYLSLVGDSSDNIPGVKGVGPKGAVQLLKSYSSLKGIYENTGKIKGSLKDKLLKDKKMAFLSRDLIALKKNIPSDKELFQKKHQPVSDFSQEDRENLRQFLEELNFKSFLKSFFPVKTESPRPIKAGEGDSESLFKDFDKGLKKTAGPPNLSGPQKTGSAKAGSAKVGIIKVGSTETGFQKAGNPKISAGPLPTWPHSQKAGSIKAGHSKILAGSISALPHFKIKQNSVEDFKQTLPPYAEVWPGFYGNQFYLFHNKQFIVLDQSQLRGMTEFLDYKWVRYLGHDLKSFWRQLKPKNPVAEWDSLIAGHLLYSTAEPSLRTLLDRAFQIPEEEELSLPQLIFHEQKLREKFLQQLDKEGMAELFREIELPLIAVLCDMEKHGFLIDLKEAEKQSQDLNHDIQNLEFQVHKLAGEKFNLSSPKQLAGILFEKLNLPKGRKTKTGYSTDSYELMKIKSLHPILPLLLEYRELFKLKSTYTDSLISLRDKKTGRVYTEFKQAVAVTGRLSSVNPNLQNIPIRTPRGQLIRKIFTAPSGYQLICADYSQLELRILAHITGDKNLQKAFEEGLDVHAMTASELFNVPLKELSSDLRRKGKAVNFGIAYGQGAYGLAESLAIPRGEAKEIIENYFKKFKKIKDYIEAVKEELPKKKYVTTLYGRRRFFQTEDLRHPRLRAALERAAINAPLQGTASDLVKKAMIALNESLPIPILSQVHDELLFECPKDDVKRESEEILSLMEKNDVLKVPLKVNLSFGPTWFSAHD